MFEQWWQSQNGVLDHHAQQTVSEEHDRHTLFCMDTQGPLSRKGSGGNPLMALHSEYQGHCQGYGKQHQKRQPCLQEPPHTAIKSQVLIQY